MSKPENKSKIIAKNVKKTYNGRQVVKDVSLEVNEGEVVGLLGPNGAGKTTTFYMIVGIVRPQTGSVFFNNEDVTKLPMYKRARMGVGYLAQEASIFRNLTVEENIKLAVEIKHKDQKKINAITAGLVRIGFS